MNVLRTITIALLVATLALSVRAEKSPPGGSNGNDHRSDRSGNGTYNIVVSGAVKGQGTATVSATSISIHADVGGENGTTITLKAENLAIKGPYFSGAGTLGDTKITVKGRLDAARASRLVATYSSDTRRGRIAGTLPTDPGSDNWDDDDHGRGPPPPPAPPPS